MQRSSDEFVAMSMANYLEEYLLQEYTVIKQLPGGTCPTSDHNHPFAQFNADLFVNNGGTAECWSVPARVSEERKQVFIVAAWDIRSRLDGWLKCKLWTKGEFHHSIPYRGTNQTLSLEDPYILHADMTVLHCLLQNKFTMYVVEDIKNMVQVENNGELLTACFNIPIISEEDIHRLIEAKKLDRDDVVILNQDGLRQLMEKVSKKMTSFIEDKKISYPFKRPSITLTFPKTQLLKTESKELEEKHEPNYFQSWIIRNPVDSIVVDDFRFMSASQCEKILRILKAETPPKKIILDLYDITPIQSLIIECFFPTVPVEFRGRRTRKYSDYCMLQSEIYMTNYFPIKIADRKIKTMGASDLKTLSMEEKKGISNLVVSDEQNEIPIEKFLDFVREIPHLESCAFLKYMPRFSQNWFDSFQKTLPLKNLKSLQFNGVQDSYKYAYHHLLGYIMTQALPSLVTLEVTSIIPENYSDAIKKIHLPSLKRLIFAPSNPDSADFTPLVTWIIAASPSLQHVYTNTLFHSGSLNGAQKNIQCLVLKNKASVFMTRTESYFISPEYFPNLKMLFLAENDIGQYGKNAARLVKNMLNLFGGQLDYAFLQMTLSEEIEKEIKNRWPHFLIVQPSPQLISPLFQDEKKIFTSDKIKKEKKKINNELAGVSSKIQTQPEIKAPVSSLISVPRPSKGFRQKAKKNKSQKKIEKKPKKEKPILSPNDYFARLLHEADQSDRPYFHICLPNARDILPVQTALMCYLQKMGRESLYLDDTKGRRRKEGWIDENGKAHKDSNSEVGQFIEEAREANSGDVLIINGTDMNPDLMALYDWVEPTSSGRVPKGVIIFVMVDKKRQMEKDFTTRYKKPHVSFPSALLLHEEITSLKLPSVPSDEKNIEKIELKLYGSSQWKFHLLGAPVLDKKNEFVGKRGLVTSLSTKRIHIHIVNPPASDDYRSFINQIYFKKRIWYRGDWLSTKHISWSEEKRSYELKLTMEEQKSNCEWDITLNPYNRNRFLENKTLGHQGWTRLHKKKYPNKPLRILVTEKVEENTFAQLEDDANACEVKLQFITAATQPFSKEENEFSKARVIQTNDPEWCAEQILEKDPKNTLVFPVFKSNRAADFLSAPVPEKKNNENGLPRLIWQRRAALNYLSKGKKTLRKKTLILVGDFSKELEQDLETLLTREPALSTNGKLETFDGKIILVSKAPLFSWYPRREKNNTNYDEKYWEIFFKEEKEQYTKEDKAKKLNQFKFLCSHYSESWVQHQIMKKRRDTIRKMSEENKEEKNNELRQRCIELKKILQWSPCAIISDEDASETIRDFTAFSNIGNKKNIETFVGTDNIFRWLAPASAHEETPPMRILLLPYPHLMASIAYDKALAVLQAPCVIAMNGEMLTVTKNHKVIVISETGKHGLFTSQAPILSFKPFSQVFIQKHFLVPLLADETKEAFSGFERILKNNKQKMGLHRQRMMCLRFLFYKNTFSHFANTEELAAIAAYEEYRHVFDDSEDGLLLLSMKERSARQQIIDEQVKQFPSAKNFHLMPSRHNAVHLVTDHFGIHKVVAGSKNDAMNFLISGLCFSGASGIGKTAINEILLSLCDMSRHSMKTSDPGEIKNELFNAWDNGGVFRRDEWNTAAKLIQVLLFELELSTKMPAKKGFFSSFTCNSAASFHFRESFSDRFKQSHYIIHLLEHPPLELKKILIGIGLHPDDAKQWVDKHLVNRSIKTDREIFQRADEFLAATILRPKKKKCKPKLVYLPNNSAVTETEPGEVKVEKIHKKKMKKKQQLTDEIVLKLEMRQLIKINQTEPRSEKKPEEKKKEKNISSFFRSSSFTENFKGSLGFIAREALKHFCRLQKLRQQNNNNSNCYLYNMIRCLEAIKKFHSWSASSASNMRYDSVCSLRNMLVHSLGVSNRIVLESVDIVLRDLPREFVLLRDDDENPVLTHDELQALNRNQQTEKRFDAKNLPIFKQGEKRVMSLVMNQDQKFFSRPSITEQKQDNSIAPRDVLIFIRDGLLPKMNRLRFAKDLDSLDDLRMLFIQCREAYKHVINLRLDPELRYFLKKVVRLIGNKEAHDFPGASFYQLNWACGQVPVESCPALLRK